MGLGDTLKHLAVAAAPAVGLAFGHPEIGAAVGSALGSYWGGQEVGQAAQQAGQINAQAAQQALDLQKQIYGGIQPYLMSSLSSYQDLLQHPESITKTPGYMFRLQEGLKAAGIPIGGRQISGPQLQRSIQYGQDYATSEYQNALARIAGLGGLATQVAGVGQNYGSTAAKLLLGGAEATAGSITDAAQANVAGTLGAGKAISQGIFDYWNTNKLNQPQPTTGAGTAGAGSPISNPANYYGGSYVAPGGSYLNTPNYGYNTNLGAEGTGFAYY